jgi:hypothetical protein
MWTTVRPSCGDLLALSPDLHLVVSGIGGANAQAAATRLLEMNCDALVSWGTAGALHPDLRSGQLVVADQITDTSGERLTPDPAWAQRVVARLDSPFVDARAGASPRMARRLASGPGVRPCPPEPGDRRPQPASRPRPLRVLTGRLSPSSCPLSAQLGGPPPE